MPEGVTVKAGRDLEQAFFASMVGILLKKNGPIFISREDAKSAVGYSVAIDFIDVPVPGWLLTLNPLSLHDKEAADGKPAE